LQGIEALWNGDIKDNKDDEIIWYKFNIKWRNIKKSIEIGKEIEQHSKI
jgi:hypothetical protein